MKIKKVVSVILATLITVATFAFTACDMFSSSSSAPKGPQIAYDKIIMSTLGDSITDEANGEKYPKMMKAELGLLRVNNYAKSGATISVLNEKNNLQQQIEKVDEDSHIISVFAGVNDFKYYSVPLGKQGYTTATTLYGALDALINGLKQRCPKAYIYFITPYKCKGYDQPNSADHVLSDYVTAIINKCNEYGLDYLNFYETGEFDYENAYYTVDGLHPLGRFYEDYATPKIIEFLEVNYPKHKTALLVK